MQVSRTKADVKIISKLSSKNMFTDEEFLKVMQYTEEIIDLTDRVGELTHRDIESAAMGIVMKIMRDLKKESEIKG